MVVPFWGHVERQLHFLMTAGFRVSGFDSNTRKAGMAMSVRDLGLGLLYSNPRHPKLNYRVIDAEPREGFFQTKRRAIRGRGGGGMLSTIARNPTLLNSDSKSPHSAKASAKQIHQSVQVAVSSARGMIEA